MPNAFTILEQKGRSIFETLCQPNIKCQINKFSTNPYANWDVSFMSASTKVIGEIKTRNYKHYHFNTWILQEDKLLKLRAIKDNYGLEDIRIMYINIFEDNKILIWDITDIKPKISQQLLARTFAGTNNEEINKNVIHLHINDALIFNL
jgi:hypothetical protein